MGTSSPAPSPAPSPAAVLGGRLVREIASTSRGGPPGCGVEVDLCFGIASGDLDPGVWNTTATAATAGTSVRPYTPWCILPGRTWDAAGNWSPLATKTDPGGPRGGRRRGPRSYVGGIHPAWPVADPAGQSHGVLRGRPQVLCDNRHISWEWSIGNTCWGTGRSHGQTNRETGATFGNVPRG
jgi:hypothetical protein